MVITGVVRKVFINLFESDFRKLKMYSLWWPNVLTRYEAVNGWKISDGTCDNLGRPRWDKEKLKCLIDKGVIHPDFRDFYNLLPTEYACTQSHINVWKEFLKSDSENLLVLEDDTRPTSLLRGQYFEDVINRIPEIKNVDMLYLYGPKHKGKRIILNKDGSVRWNRSHMGYFMDRKSAELAIDSMAPIIYQSDLQVGLRIFKSLVDQKHAKFPSGLPELERIVCSGLFDPLVEHNELACVTTFTQNGKKDWLPKSCQV